MVSLILKSALLAASLINVATAQSTAAVPIPTPTSHPTLQAPKYGGCFDNPGHMVDYGPATYQSTGNCAPICAGLKKPVMALVDGANCWCGDLGPASGQTDDEDCTTPCQGYNKETCGGNQHWAFYSSGLTAANIDYEKDAASSSAPSSAAPTSQGTQPTQKPGETTIVQTVPGSVQTQTEAPQPTNADDNNSNNGGGTNKTAIAVGVVVGIVALAAICGGAFLFLRRREQKRAEESYRHHQSMQNFTSGKPPGTSHSSLTDNRLDPEIMMRRQSDGSIADNQDYSRRILQVTNI